MEDKDNNAAWGCVTVLVALFFCKDFLWQFTRALLNGELEDIRQKSGDGIFSCVVIFIYGLFILGFGLLFLWMLLSGKLIDWFFKKFMK